MKGSFSGMFSNPVNLILLVNLLAINVNRSSAPSFCPDCAALIVSLYLNKYFKNLLKIITKAELLFNHGARSINKVSIVFFIR